MGKATKASKIEQKVDEILDQENVDTEETIDQDPIEDIEEQKTKAEPTYQSIKPSQKRKPINRARIEPKGLIQVYTITSEQIKAFIKAKAKYYVPDAIVQTIITFSGSKIEGKKGKNKLLPGKNYASARISFSDHVISAEEREQSWYDKLGEQSNVHFVKDIYFNMIKKYQYDRKEIDDILNNYKKMSELEDMFNIDESFLNDIKMYITPKKINIDSNNSCIIFSARPEAIIEDMLSDPETGKVNGTIEIKEVFPNKDVVHFIIYLHQAEVKTTVNPFVKELVETSAGSKIY